MPTPNPNYAVVVHTPPRWSNARSENEYFLNRLGVNWFLDYDYNQNNIPDGTQKLVYIQMPRDQALWSSGALENIATVGDAKIAEWGFSDPVKIRQTAFQNPGLTWYLFGETNRRGYMHGNRFAPVFKYFVDQITGVDGTAKIVSPSILNWDYTCIGCYGGAFCENWNWLSGYQCGVVWFKSFVDSYRSRYQGEYPPVDIWAIDVYPLDWWDTPNSGAHALRAIQQLVNMRAYLNSIPEYQNTPIWITEIAVHVGYSLDANREINGPYRADLMAEYMTTILDWLNSNAEAQLIDKWFFFVTWRDIVNVQAADPYMGITFFENRESGSALNCLGEIYRAYSLYGSSQGKTC